MLIFLLDIIYYLFVMKLSWRSCKTGETVHKIMQVMPVKFEACAVKCDTNVQSYSDDWIRRAGTKLVTYSWWWCGFLLPKCWTYNTCTIN